MNLPYCRDFQPNGLGCYASATQSTTAALRTVPTEGLVRDLLSALSLSETTNTVQKSSTVTITVKVSAKQGGGSNLEFPTCSTSIISDGALATSYMLDSAPPSTGGAVTHRRNSSAARIVTKASTVIVTAAVSTPCFYNGIQSPSPCPSPTTTRSGSARVVTKASTIIVTAATPTLCYNDEIQNLSPCPPDTTTSSGSAATGTTISFSSGTRRSINRMSYIASWLVLLLNTIPLSPAIYTALTASNSLLPSGLYWTLCGEITLFWFILATPLAYGLYSVYHRIQDGQETANRRWERAFMAMLFAVGVSPIALFFAHGLGAVTHVCWSCLTIAQVSLAMVYAILGCRCVFAIAAASGINPAARASHSTDQHPPTPRPISIVPNSGRPLTTASTLGCEITVYKETARLFKEPVDIQDKSVIRVVEGSGHRLEDDGGKPPCGTCGSGIGG